MEEKLIECLQHQPSIGGRELVKVVCNTLEQFKNLHQVVGKRRVANSRANKQTLKAWLHHPTTS